MKQAITQVCRVEVKGATPTGFPSRAPTHLLLDRGEEAAKIELTAES
ncbi:MAG: hypothetical protein IH905_01570 [Proteobacteria bacterium]|nr:hypothetical protein [Pseudomonadota bacterium]